MVYFVESELGLIKIGYTENPTTLKQRINSMRVDSPVHLWLLGTIIHATRAQEQRLHQRFHWHRYRGEWFSPHVREELERLFPWELALPTLYSGEDS